MQESVIYRSTQEEAEAKKQREIANNLLREGLAIEMVGRVIRLIAQRSPTHSTTTE